MRRPGPHIAVLKMGLFLAMTCMLVLGPSLACKSFPDDLTIKGDNMVVDCSRQGLTAETIRHNLNFPGATTLILSRNNVHVLKNDSFTQHNLLRELACEWCELRRLEVDALKGLERLEILRLTNNQLKIIDNAFPRGFFGHVPNLKTLHIGGNGNSGQAGNYSQFIDIFDSLEELVELSIDSFSHLRIGEEFLKLAHLKKLNVVCTNVLNISGISFKGFQDSGVKLLSLTDGALYNGQADTSAFQYLPNISSLWIYNLGLGNKNVLKMMRPLQGRHMDEIKFDSTSFKGERNIKRGLEDMTFKPENTKYLTNVCVSRFSWDKMLANTVESGSFYSDVWRSCLKSIYFMNDRADPSIDMGFLHQLAEFPQLKYFVFMPERASAVQDFWKDDGELDEYRSISMNMYSFPTFYIPMATNYQDERRAISPNQRYSQEVEISQNDRGRNMGTQTKIPINSFYDLNNRIWNKTLSTSNRQNELRVHLIRKRNIVIRIPPRLETLIVDGGGSLKVNTDVRFKENRLQSLYYRKAHGAGFAISKRWLGLNHLRVIDFSSTNINILVPDFFKGFPSLKRLVLKDTHRNPTFYSESAGDCPQLEYFDISDNDLVWLPEKTFSFNHHLKYLSLASNRFHSLPIDMRLTPNLKILDLRGNSLLSLPAPDRKMIDAHARRVHGISLLMDHNPFSCTCSSLPFLKWLLQSRLIQFDKDANYTCFTEDGTFSYTASYSDIESFWRKCQGRYYFLVSMILAFTLTTTFLLVYLGSAHKTQIMSKVMQLVAQGFHLQNRQHFAYDVCIGYADQDGEYVRNTLLRYLESMWKLRTFVHQRDMLHDPLLMSNAIRDSWRNVLLITENFLDHHEMAHNIMKVATFFVRPSNPCSVLVMVEENVRHRVPDYVLQVVHEDNIIVLPGLEPFLDYEAKETLKNRIFC